MKKIRMGIVGLNFGQHILREITEGSGREWVEPAAVCDMNEEKLAAVAAQYGVAAYRTLDELLLDPDVDAVGLFTPPVGRAALLSKILDAGKPIMTTKPFELDDEAGLAVLRRAREEGKVIHLNSPSPLLSPEMELIVRWSAEHDLGRPVACRADVWCSYRESYTDSWYDDPDQCPVAPIYRIGIYLINDLVRIFGEAEELQVMSSRVFTGRPTPDNAQLTIKFASGAICTLFASFCVADGQPYKNALTLNYERGTIYRNTGAKQPKGLYELSEMTLATLDGDSRFAVVEQQVQGGSGQYQWEAFNRAAHGVRLEGEVTPEEIIAGIRIIRAMSRAEKSGRTERI